MESTASLWNSYSNVYDILNEFSPYQEHLNLLLNLSLPRIGQLYLDAGCGTGNLTLQLVQKGCQVIGLDYSEEMLEIARKKVPQATFLLANLDDPLNFADNSIDGIVSNNVIAYLSDVVKILAEFRRVLKPGAIIVLATLKDNWSPLAVYRQHLRRKGFLHSVRIIFPLLMLGVFNIEIQRRIKGGQYHTYSERKLFSLFRDAGFEGTQIQLSYADQDVVAFARK